MIEEHLDYMSHPADWPKVFPEVGVIKAVRAKDHPNSLVETFTTYDVTVFFQQSGVTMPRDFEHVPARGQFAGGAVEVEFDYVVDQNVIVGFLGGDIQRPYIQGNFPSHENDIARDEADGPRVRIKANGAEVLIDKDGNISLVPKSGEQLALAALADDASLEKLVDERFFAAFKSVVDGVTIVPNDGGLALKTGISSYLLSPGSVVTESTKAK